MIGNKALKKDVDCLCDKVKSLEAKQKAATVSIYRLAPILAAQQGILNREWHDTKPIVVPLTTQSTTAFGRQCRLTHDLNSAPTTQTVVTSLSLNDTDDTTTENDVQVLDTYITAPAGGIWIQYSGASEGYWAIEVGECCGPLKIKAELGYSDRLDNQSVVGPVFLPEGQHYLRAWNIDSGGTNSSHAVQYSTDGQSFSATVPAGVEFSMGKRATECNPDHLACDAVPEGWSKCQPKDCTPNFPDNSQPEAADSPDDQKLSWDAGACELSLEDGGDPIDISPTTTTGTRGQIKALMNAGNLKPGRQYCITGYARGCITAGKIYLTAIDVNLFSMDVDVLTEHDNIAWEGRYDCNTGRIVELRDNRNNVAHGQNSVDDFPWGNALWNEVTHRNADLVVPCDSALRVTNVTFDTDASINLTGATGSINDSNFGSDSQLNLQGAAINIQDFVMDSRARVLGDNATAVIIGQSKMESEAYWDFRNRNDVRLVGTTLESTARVYFRGGDRQWLYQMNVGSRAEINQTAGIIQFYYGSVADFADLNMNSAFQWFEYGSHFGSRSIVTNNQTNRVIGYYQDIRSRSELNLTGTASLRMFYNDIGAYSRMWVSGTTTIVYTTGMTAQGYVRYTGGTHYRDVWSGLCDITVPFNTRSCYCHGRIIYTLTVANTNRGSDYHHLPGSAVPALQ